MDKKSALQFLIKWAETTKWREIAAEVGEPEYMIYSWVRRGSVPKWRVKQVEAIAKRRKQESGL